MEEENTFNGSIQSEPTNGNCEPIEEEKEDGDTQIRNRGNVIYGVEDVPPWPSTILMGIQHFSLSATSCFLMPLILAPSLCFDQDRELLNMSIASSFFICGLTTVLQSLLGSRLPIIQGPSSAYIISAIVFLGVQGPCPPPLTANSTTVERQEVRDVALDRMQQIQGSLALASLVQVLIGCTGFVGVLLRFVRPITIGTTLLLISLAIIPIASDACGGHWAIASVCIFQIVLYSQFLSRYSIPLPRGRKFALFTLFSALLALTTTWLLCYILTSVGAFPEDSSTYGYLARTDLYSEEIKNAEWVRIPYPGQFGVPSVNAAGFIGLTSSVIASVVESVGDYHACALIVGKPPPPVHAINRGIMMEGVGCMAAGLWGSPFGYTSYSGNISIISLTKIASRASVYVVGGLCFLCAVFFKFSAFCASMPAPVYGGILATTIGMIAAIGIANLSFIKVDASRNLFIIGFSIFVGLGVPYYIKSNPGSIQTGSIAVDQILIVVLGSSMFIGGVTACILDNIVYGTPEEKGTDWRQRMAASCLDDEDDGGTRCYDLPFGMDWIKKTQWIQRLPFSPSFTGMRFRQLNSKGTDI